jgi:hypothetical protein
MAIPSAERMSGRITEVIQALSTYGFHRAIEDEEAAALYDCTLRLQREQPTAENQMLMLCAALMVDITMVAREEPAWAGMVEIGTTSDGEVLFESATSDVKQYYALQLTNNAIARCMAGGPAEGYAERVARKGLSYFSENSGFEAYDISFVPSISKEHKERTASSGDYSIQTFLTTPEELAALFRGNRWAAALFVVLARQAYTPELVSGYGMVAKNILETCPSATPDLRDQARTFAKRAKPGGLKSKLGALNKLPNLQLPPSKFIWRDLFLFGE